MSFLRRLFGRREPDLEAYLSAMIEMADEGERTHRGTIATYNGDVELGLLSGPEAAASGRGLYMARLFGASHIAVAYAKAGGSEAKDFLNAATGLALEPLQEPGPEHISRGEATEIAGDWLLSLIPLLGDALDEGPFSPGSTSSAFIALTDVLHGVVSESIGSEHYTAEVRERFSVAVQGNVAASTAHAKRWAE